MNFRSGILHNEDLVTLSSLLTKAGIKHGPLVELPPTFHAILSDGAHVFVKITRPNETVRFGHEIWGANLVRGLGIDAPAPLLDEVQQFVSHDGTVRYFTVWEYIESVGVLDEAMVMDVCGVMNRLAATPRPDELRTFSTGKAIDSISRRFADDNSDFAVQMLSYARRLETVIAGRLDESSFVLLHGDPHYDNVMSRNGRAMLVDWESITFGPIEWDIAQMIRPFTERQLVGVTLDTIELTVLAETNDIGVDADLVELCRALRSVSHVSYLHYHGLHGNVFKMVTADIVARRDQVERLLLSYNTLTLNDIN